MSQSPNPEVAILNAALEQPAHQRAAYLAAACANDPALRKRAEELLKALEEADSFLESPAQKPLSLNPPPTEKPGDTIGRYKLLQQIGEGGCGIVYMAEQQEPVRRRVALKVIKLGMDTKQVIARFEAERQALALMDHPNIAKVLDAGATETGRPYFVMELVRGTKITEFCEEHKVSTEERLKLFVQICNAIQHAHQKGIIHRDIKPSNILITFNDGIPVPKVIDFGIAKATAGRLTDRTLFTAFEQFIGTPAYMSPEQALMTSVDIDTRSDIYSLGVLLYELLTGTTPFDAKELLSSGLDEMRRTIREVEPVKPSTRLTRAFVAADVNLQEPKNDVKARVSSRWLPQEVIGDLDWIVMKCLEKDRTRRYETANGLAADILNHLSNEPIVARPPSRPYLFKKFIQRNRLGFVTSASVVAALVLGLCIATWALVREREARREAQASMTRAEAEAARNKAISEFFVHSPLPAIRRGMDTKLVHAMTDELSRRANVELVNQPQAQGDILVFLANRISAIDDIPRAITNLQKAVEAYRRAGTNAQLRLARTLVTLGSFQNRNNELAAARSHALLGIEVARQCGDFETLATCLLDAAKVLNDSGEPGSEVIPILRESLELRGTVVPSYLAQIETMRMLAKALAADGKSDEANRLAEQALEQAPTDADLKSFLHELAQASTKTNQNHANR